MDERDPLLSQAYRQADHPVPPAALDAAILLAARQAAAKPAPRRRGWLRWAVPASSLVVLVLATTLVLKVRREAPEHLSTDRTPVPAAAHETAAPPPFAEAAPAPNVPSKPSMPAKAARPKPPADMPPRPAAEPAAGLPGSGHAEVDALPVPASPQTAPAPALALAAKMQRIREELARHSTETAAAATPYRMPSASDAGAARGAPPAEEARMMLKATQQRPTSWGIRMDVERIRRLLSEGNQNEARKMLMELVRRHPDYELPEDLRGLRDTLPAGPAPDEPAPAP